MVCQGNAMKLILTGSVVPLFLLTLVFWGVKYGTTYLFFLFKNDIFKAYDLLTQKEASQIDSYPRSANSTLSCGLREKLDTQNFALFKCYFIKYLQFKVS